MQPLRSLVAAIGFVALAAGPALAQDTLYKRLGGYDGIVAVTDAFLGRLATDDRMKRFFVGHGDDSTRRIRQQIVDFLCENSGGPCFYTGRTMKVSHKGLKISKADWDQSAKLFVEVLNQFKVPEPLQKEVVAFVVSLEKDIVE